MEDPLEQAIRFLQPLQTLAARRIETHLMAFEIYSRKSKLVFHLENFFKAYKSHSVSDVPVCELNHRKANINILYFWRHSLFYVWFSGHELCKNSSKCLWIWHSGDLGSWYILIIKSTRCRDALISQNYFWNRTLRVSDRFSVHHQEYTQQYVYVIQVSITCMTYILLCVQC